MNKWRKISSGLAIALMIYTIPGRVYPQAGEIDRFIQAGIEDANTLMGPYISPFMKGLGFGFANGWYNTAEAHQILGFDLTVSGNVAFVPDEDLFYNVLDLELNEVQAEFPNLDGEVPTVFGLNERPVYSFKSDPTRSSFEGPPGLDLERNIGANFVPVPTVNIGIGLPMKTDLKVRYLPEIEADDFRVKMWGVGVLHDVKQYIPVVNKMPFDMSVLIGYTRLKTEVGLSGAVDDGGNNNQTGKIGINSWTAQLLVSKKFTVITLYAGVGANKVDSNLQILGTYVLDPSNPDLTTFEDPIDLDFNNNGARFTAGLRLKLAVFTLHADYTFQEYEIASAGIGLRFR